MIHDHQKREKVNHGGRAFFSRSSSFFNYRGDRNESWQFSPDTPREAGRRFHSRDIAAAQGSVKRYSEHDLWRRAGPSSRAAAVSLMPGPPRLGHRNRTRGKVSAFVARQFVHEVDHVNKSLVRGRTGPEVLLTAERNIQRILFTLLTVITLTCSYKHQ